MKDVIAAMLERARRHGAGVIRRSRPRRCGPSVAWEGAAVSAAPRELLASYAIAAR